MRVFENRDEILWEQISPNELIHELAKNRKNLSKEPIECNFYELADDVPDPKEISPEHKNLMIFDDLLLQKQNKCEAYYVRGRYSNCDCLYLNQNYFKFWFKYKQSQFEYLHQKLWEIQIGVWWLLYYLINEHWTSWTNWEKYFSEIFNSDCGFRELDKNKNDF